MLPLATAHIAHLCAKAYTGRWGFKPSSLLIRHISFEISPYCAKQASSFFTLILIRIFNYGKQPFCHLMQHCKRLSVILKLWNVVLRVRVTSSSVGGREGGL